MVGMDKYGRGQVLLLGPRTQDAVRWFSAPAEVKTKATQAPTCHPWPETEHPGHACPLF